MPETTTAPDAPTVYDALGENNKDIRRRSGPRNISPEMMGRYKAQVWNAIMGGGFTVSADLAGWDTYTDTKKAKLISEIDSMEEIRFVLAHEEDSDLLQAAIVKKRVLERQAQLSDAAERPRE